MDDNFNKILNDIKNQDNSGEDLIKKIGLKKGEEMLKILTSKKYSRDYPYDSHGMLKIVKDNIINNKKTNLVGFWGASEKEIFEYSEEQLIKNMLRFQEDLLGVVSFTFILSDMHALMNRYKKEKIETYLSLVKRNLENVGIKTILLSDLWKEWGLSTETILNQVDSFDLSDSVLKEKLLKQATKHFQGSDKVLGAKVYYIMRKTEALFIKKTFAGSILFSFTDATAHAFLPDMPTLYLYTTKRDVTAVPWFREY
ncbi:MAG: hypothetical protein K9L98_03475 [Candidatus Pacebacteria bacterium]|nr:hypothetical protein [Candidatus Paceibacterota bacterium]MCF7863039.1 hypothetical protein [Candidatus Paceibacterota bacterium]